jgi:hypothetical protein
MFSVCISFLLLFSYPLIGLVLWDRRIKKKKKVGESLFVLSPEIEDRDEVEVATGRSTKRPTLDICHPCTRATRVIPQWHRLNIG